MCAVQIAQFSFTLPPLEQMGELLPWMQAAMYMIDSLGSYRMKPDQKVRYPLASKTLALAHSSSMKLESDHRMLLHVWHADDTTPRHLRGII